MLKNCCTISTICQYMERCVEKCEYVYWRDNTKGAMSLFGQNQLTNEQNIRPVRDSVTAVYRCCPMRCARAMACRSF